MMRTEVPYLNKGVTGSTPQVSVDLRMAGVDENMLAGRLTRALSLVREKAGKKRKVRAGTTDGGDNIFAFYSRMKRADEGCAFPNVNGFCNYIHMDKFEMSTKRRQGIKKDRSEW